MSNWNRRLWEYIFVFVWVNEGVKYACDQCDYQATTKFDLTRHNKSRHEGIKYDCDQCEYQATSQSSLKRHSKAVH